MAEPVRFVKIKTCKKCQRVLESDVEKQFNTCYDCLTFKGTSAEWDSLENWQKNEYLYVCIRESEL